MTVEPAGRKTPKQRGRGVARESQVVATRGTEATSSVDWATIKVAALTRGGRFTTGRRQCEGSRGGASFADAVQEAVAELHARWAAGEALPTEADRLAALVATGARRRWKAWSKRAREQQVNLQRLAPTLSAREMFDLICARDEQTKLLTRLYQALEDEPHARLLLYLILEKGILFEETRLLAAELSTSTVHVTNMKRRIIRLAHRLMTELTGAGAIGGRT